MTDFITRRRISQEWERKRKADFVAYSQARSIVVLADAADVMFIESNYDEKMLDEGPYPAHLKKRIKGIYGHLSNTEAVEFASKVARRGESVYFVHVSENNNDTNILRDLAYSKIPSGIFCKICERGELFEGFIDGKEQGKGEEKGTEEGIQPQGMQEGRTI